MKYFAGCETNSEVKARFRELCKALHPDCGGDAGKFAEMMSEYEVAFERCKDFQRYTDGTIHEKKTGETAMEYAKAYEAIMHIPGIEITLCGSWLWVTGNTRDCKEILKENGFRWSPKKVAWSWHSPNEIRLGKHRAWTMNEIYDCYGREKLDTEELMAIA